MTSFHGSLNKVKSESQIPYAIILLYLVVWNDCNVYMSTLQVSSDLDLIFRVKWSGKVFFFGVFGVFLGYCKHLARYIWCTECLYGVIVYLAVILIWPWFYIHGSCYLILVWSVFQILSGISKLYLFYGMIVMYIYLSDLDFIFIVNWSILNISELVYFLDTIIKV